MIRKPASDSITGLIQSAKDSVDVIEPPEYCEPLTKREQKRWDAWINAKDSWKESDLDELHALVKMKSDYDAFTREERQSSIGVSFYKQIQAQIRVIGLNSTHATASRNASQGKVANRGRSSSKAGVSLVK